MFDELAFDFEYPLVERRRDERSRLIVEISFDGAEATGIASTRDIGVGGLYMSTRATLPEGARLTLCIPCSDEHVVVNAEVIYSNPGRGVGVRFCGLAQRDRELIGLLETAVPV